MVQSGTLPTTGAIPIVPGRFPVKFDVEGSATGPVPRRRRCRPRRDLHRARGDDPHPAHGDPARRRDHRLPRAQAALMATRIVLAAAVAAALAGCALKAPPARGTSPRRRCPTCTRRRWSSTSALAPGAVGGGWLTSFADPQLDALVRGARLQPDLRVAAARVEQAAAYVQLSGSTLYPQVAVRAAGSLGADSSGVRAVGCSPTGNSTCGAACAPASRRRRTYASAELDAEFARQSIAALVIRAGSSPPRRGCEGDRRGDGRRRGPAARAGAGPAARRRRRRI